jgi:hypothetical protein
MEERIPPDLEEDLLRRVREQIGYEVLGDVTALYEMTLPEIRRERAEAIEGIGEFVRWVESAVIESIQVDAYTPRATARPGHPPAARVLLAVRYNGGEKVARLATVWVRRDGAWFTTSLGKLHGGQA